MTLGPKQKTDNLTFSVAALKRQPEKTPDCRITFYLSFGALISLSPENLIQGIVFPTIYNPYSFHTNVAASQRDADQTLSLTYAKSLTSYVVIYRALGSLRGSLAYVEVLSLDLLISCAGHAASYVLYLTSHVPGHRFFVRLR